MVQALGGLREATSAAVLSFDRYGFDVLAQTPEGPRRTRVGFASPIGPANAGGGGTVSELLQAAVVEQTRKSKEMLSIF